MMTTSAILKLFLLALVVPCAPSLAFSPISAYSTALTMAPLETKVATATVLGFAGDLIAQRRAANLLIAQDSVQERPPALPEGWYDTKRAASFALFDAGYRGLFQHVTFPWIIQAFPGDSLTHLAVVLQQPVPDRVLMAAAERTIFNQGYVQGLSSKEAMVRAKRDFPKLLRRNVVFWVPVQISQFALIPENWQIPYLSVVGLAWTVILSTSAGSARASIDERSDDDKIATASSSFSLPSPPALPFFASSTSLSSSPSSTSSWKSPFLPPSKDAAASTNAPTASSWFLSALSSRARDIAPDPIQKSGARKAVSFFGAIFEKESNDNRPEDERLLTSIGGAQKPKRATLATKKATGIGSGGGGGGGRSWE